MIAHVLIVVDLLKQDRHIFWPGSGIAQLFAWARDAWNAVQHVITDHRIRQAAFVDIKPNFVLLKYEATMNDEKIKLYSDDRGRRTGHAL